MKVVEKALDKLEIGEDGKAGMDDVLTFLSRGKDADIDRKSFLEETFSGKVSAEVIEKAIANDPVRAGIPIGQLKEIAAEVIAASKSEPSIKEHRKETIEKAAEGESALKKVASVVGSLKENRYKKTMIRATLRLMYLFGFGQIEQTEKGTIISEKDKLAVVLAGAYIMDVENAADAFRALLSVYPKIDDDYDAVPDAVAAIVKSYRQKYIAFRGILAAAGAAKKPVGKALHKVTFSVRFEKSCYKLVELLSDTAFSNPRRLAGELESEFAEAFLNGQAAAGEN